MATGGHHGGGHHTGGHHGGGGFEGGFSGIHRSLYRSSGNDIMDSYNMDTVWGTAENYPSDPFAKILGEIAILVFGSGMMVISFLLNFSGFNFTNMFIFAVTMILFVIAFSNDGNTSELKNFKHKEVPPGSGNIYKAWEGSRARDAFGNNATWASQKGTYYAISFFEKDHRDSNLKQVHETVQRTPSIIWLSSKVWIFIAAVCFAANFFFYEAVIPVFENATMTYRTFHFMDEFVFYLPSVIALLSGIACLVFRKIRHKLLHACAMRIVEDNYAADVRIKTYGVIENAMSIKWFYDNCPNCGSTAPKNITSCPFCGSSLEVLSYEDADPNTIHRLSSEEDQ